MSPQGSAQPLPSTAPPVQPCVPFPMSPLDWTGQGGSRTGAGGAMEQSVMFSLSCTRQLSPEIPPGKHQTTLLNSSGMLLNLLRGCHSSASSTESFNKPCDRFPPQAEGAEDSQAYSTSLSAGKQTLTHVCAKPSV